MDFVRLLKMFLVFFNGASPQSKYIFLLVQVNAAVNRRHDPATATLKFKRLFTKFKRWRRFIKALTVLSDLCETSAPIGMQHCDECIMSFVLL